jgi:small-conductance mechanosensitive channel
MDLEEIQTTIESIQELDERRRETFEEEYETADDAPSFPRTKDLIAEEYEQLDRLDGLLEVEREQLDQLVEQTEFLTVDQAVRHRNQAVSKLEERNGHLVAFHEAMTDALDVIESNIEALESRGEDSVEESPESHLEDAREALEAHNEAIEGLKKNMEILNTYLM